MVFINIILSIIIVFFKRREPKTVWIWIFALNFLPIIGFIFYMIIEQDIHKSHMFHVKEVEDKLNYAIKLQETVLKQHDTDSEDDKIVTAYLDMALYNLEVASAVYTRDNHIDIFTDGNDKFKTLVEDILSAKQYILFQYYIIKDDEAFEPIKKALIEKAQAGIEVKVLYDSMGCRMVSNKLWREFRKAGIKVGEFFPAILGRLQLRVNYRNHRKAVIIDGKIGYVGGFNIGKEYISLSKKFGNWRDTHLRITGSAVIPLQVIFALDWNYTVKENLFVNQMYFKDTQYKQTSTKGIGVQIISSGPDSRYNAIHDNYLMMIHSAKQAIWIQTPYFVPSESILTALKIAAKSGVEVHLMIPCKPDHPFVYWATYSYMGELLEEGVNCYIYENGFIHAKGIIVDNKIASYGTANMDIRSFSLNFEVNAMIYNEEIATKLQKTFQKDIENSNHITLEEYNRRSFIIKIKQQISRLLSPLL